MSRRLALQNTSTKYHPPGKVLDSIRDALDSQLHQLATRWGEYVFTISDQARAAGFAIVLMDNPDVANALGYHDTGPTGTPYARVFLDPIFQHGGTWTDGPLSVSAVVSHEMCELIGDPGANRWANDRNGTVWALELCDAVENDSYPIETVAGLVSVSNWLWPAYFNPLAIGQFDQMGTLKAPFTIAKGGYAIRMQGGNIDQVFGEDYPEAKKATKTEGSRTRARFNWCSPLKP